VKTRGEGGKMERDRGGRERALCATKKGERGRKERKKKRKGMGERSAGEGERDSDKIREKEWKEREKKEREEVGHLSHCEWLGEDGIIFS
jgi:hypothetical protein